MMAIGLIAAGSLGFAAPTIRNLNSTEKQKVREAIDLVEEMYKKANRLDKKMVDWLNAPGDPGGAAGQIDYEDPNATFQDAINKLRDKLDSDRIQVREVDKNGGSTRNRSGTDADIVILNEGQLTKMCSTGDDGGRLARKVNLASTLANEMVHVWQVFTGDDLKQCDAERDSDTATIIFMSAIAFEVDGVAPGDIDATECPKLAKCIMDYGVTAGPEWNTFVSSTVGLLEAYIERREEKFDDLIDASLSWGEGYYGEGDYRGPIKFAEVTGVDQLRLEAADGSERFYTLPAGKRVIRRAVTRNDANQVVLTIVAVDDNTNVICTYVYTDTDGDTLPEPTPVVTQATQPGKNETDNNDIFMLPFAPGDQSGVQSAWTLIDINDGIVYHVPLDPLSLQPAAPFFDPIYFDPLLSRFGGGFFYLDERLPGPVPDVELWLFSSTPLVMNHGDQPAILMEIDLINGFWNPVFNGSIAEALAPTNFPGILQLDAGLAQVELMGVPGGDAMIFDIGNGFPQPLLPQPEPIGFNGLTPQLPIPPMPPGLFLIESFFGPTGINQVTHFQPPFGENIACLLVDENNDGADERLHLTLDPPRLHVFEGIPGAALGEVQHIYELVLETDMARDFLTWDDINGRVLSTMLFDNFQFPFAAQLGLPVPFYVQSLHDMDGDTNADDTVYALATDLSGSNYNLVSAQDVLGVPFPLSVEPLAFVPGQISVQDLDGDTFPDALLTDFFGGPDQCFINDGFGALVAGSCNPCVADVNGDGMLTPTDFTAWINAFNNNLPECDQNGDGLCTPTDFTAWIANYNAGC